MPEGVIYMIEVIYKDEKQTAKGNEESFNLPKNIRQIGIPNEKYRIYIEDYVYTFLKKIAEKAEEEEKGAAAVFTGEIKWNSGTGYLFIRGALTAEAGEISAEHVEFSDLTWQKLHEEIEHYFAGQEIIGWFLTQKSLQMEVTEGVQRIHMKLFGGEKALMLMDPVEKEEAFFCYDNGRLLRQSGYYIYYEKNPQMQDFVLGENQNESVDREYDDVVTEVIRDRVNKNEKKDSVSKTAIAALTMAIAFMFVIGGNYMIESVSKINSLEDSVDVLQGYVKTTYGDDDNSKNVSGAGIGAEWDKEENADKAENAKKISMTKEKTGNSVQSSDTEKKRKSNDKNTGTGKNNSLSTARRDRLKRKKTAGKVNKIKKTGKMSKAARQTINNRKNIKRITGSHRNYAEYKVKEGDTLSTIVWRQYHTLKKMNMVKRVNRIQNSDNIREGQVIKLPAR